MYLNFRLLIPALYPMSCTARAFQRNHRTVRFDLFSTKKPAPLQ